MSYLSDALTLRHGKIDDGTMRFSTARAGPRPAGTGAPSAR